MEVFQVPDAAVREVAASTAAMIPSRSLVPQSRGTIRITGKSYGADYNLCQDEPFYSQPTAAMCSGFLVGDNLLATAGHCIKDTDCANNSFVFGFKMENEQNAAMEVAPDQVYKCKRIVSRELTRQQDYALVELDRPVVGVRPLRLQQTDARVNDAIIVIGHPSGLPTKVAAGAGVRRLDNGFFVANLDTYGGNSGSAVFNANTLEVVGILVRGEQDFAYDQANKCTRSNYCTDTGCRGEDVTHISYINRAMPGPR
jgi:V8-like Glu-specific endopeptidase